MSRFMLMPSGIDTGGAAPGWAAFALHPTREASPTPAKERAAMILLVEENDFFI
jgi:hypothetical protein